MQWPVDIDTDPLSVTYDVFVPPGEQVEIGKAKVGLGYEINQGGSSFVCFADVRFTVNPDGTPETPNGLFDPDEGYQDPDSEDGDH